MKIPFVPLALLPFIAAVVAPPAGAAPAAPASSARLSPGAALLAAVRDARFGNGAGSAASDLQKTTKSGAVWVNADYEAGRSAKWWIEQQKVGGDFMQQGVLTGNRALINTGLQVTDWGFAKQAGDGSFTGSAFVHSTSLFIEGTARGLLLLKQYDAPGYQTALARDVPKLRAAAHWLMAPEQAEERAKNYAGCVHRYYIFAAALGEAAALTGDADLARLAAEAAKTGMARQKENGVNPEKNGYDVSYQGLGVFMASRYYFVCSDPNVRRDLKKMINAALQWESGHIGPNGEINADGSTRTGVETNHAGNLKTPDKKAVRGAFVFGAQITGNKAFAAIAERIAEPDTNAPIVAMPTSAERAEKRNVLRAALQKSVADLDSRIAQNKSGITGRDISNGALARLLLSDGTDAAGAESLLKRLLVVQNADPQSADFGKMPWNIDNDTIQDANSIEFGTQAWGPIVLGYGDKLSPAFKTAFLARFPACFATLRRHDVKVSYTNIFLMKTVCMILMGEAGGDAKAANEGYDALDTWLAYTRENGIREFGSPTYYATSMGSLLNGHRFARRPGAQEKFKQALDFFWADIGSHYFAGQQSLSGPHSRDYDFLVSVGGGTLYMYSEGLRSHERITSIDLEKTHLVMNQEPGGYHPGAFLYELANTPQRWVEEKWDSAPDQVRTTFITPDFSLGSTNRNYGPQDKMINLELAGHWPDAKRLPGITIVADDTDSPYGKAKTKDKSGHSKPRHLKLTRVTVQNMGDLLAFTDANSGEARTGTTSIATNVILPAKADLLTVGVAGKEKISTKKPFTRPLPFGEVVGLRAGNTAVAVRVLQGGSLGGQTPSLCLQADEDGLKDDALRLSVYHWKGAGPVPTTGDAQAVVLILVAPCKSEADYAALLRRAADAKYTMGQNGKNGKTISVQVAGTTLSANYDTETHLPGERTINKQLIVPPLLLSVNNKEIGRPLLPIVPAANAAKR